MFPQILRSAQFDTTCLQQSRKKKKRVTIVCFLKEKISRRVRRPAFSGGQHCDSMQPGHRKKEMLGLVIDWFQTTRNNCQHCCSSMQTDATCWAQQCYVSLAKNVASVCMGLYAHVALNISLLFVDNYITVVIMEPRFNELLYKIIMKSSV